VVDRHRDRSAHTGAGVPARGRPGPPDVPRHLAV